jgi:hypothetical protein
MVGRSSRVDLLFCVVLKEGRYSLTTTADCCLIEYPFTKNTPDTMWMGLVGVGGVSTSCEASIGMVVLQFGDFAPFQAGKSVPAMVDCHFAQSHYPLYLPIYILQEGSDHFTEVSCKMESRNTVSRLESRFSDSFQGRQAFTYHDGRLLSHSISFYQHCTKYHVNGFVGCWWGLHFMPGKYRYGCAPVWRSSHCFEQEFPPHRW